jgi:hypothetical protein
MNTATESLRLAPEDLRKRLAAGEPVTLLDTRGAAAWDASGEKVPGATHVDAHQLRVSPAWPKGQLTVAYCT